MNKTCAIYIMTNYLETSLYIGVTSNLQKRVWEHKNDIVKMFQLKNDAEAIKLAKNLEKNINSVSFNEEKATFICKNKLSSELICSYYRQRMEN